MGRRNGYLRPLGCSLCQPLASPGWAQSWPGRARRGAERMGQSECCTDRAEIFVRLCTATCNLRSLSYELTRPSPVCYKTHSARFCSPPPPYIAALHDCVPAASSSHREWFWPLSLPRGLPTTSADFRLGAVLTSRDTHTMPAKKRCQLQTEPRCNSAVLRLVGQCPHCRAEFCGAVSNSRLLPNCANERASFPPPSTVCPSTTTART